MVSSYLGARLELWPDLAAPSRWLWVQGGQEPPQELEGSLSSSGQPPIFAHQPLPVSSEYHSPDSGWWPLLARSPRALCVPASPRALLPPEAEPRGALAASEHLGEGAGPDWSRVVLGGVSWGPPRECLGPRLGAFPHPHHKPWLGQALRLLGGLRGLGRGCAWLALTDWGGLWRRSRCLGGWAGQSGGGLGTGESHKWLGFGVTSPARRCWKREETMAAGVTLGSSCSRLLLTQAARNPLPITHSLAPQGHM